MASRSQAPGIGKPNTPALALEDHISEEEKTRRLTILQEMQRDIQIRRNSALVGIVEESFVEGYNQATGQWIGRTTQNRPLNFIHPEFPRSEERRVGKEGRSRW